eukprot:Trichotokara_eunicae@DN336_c0_g1_i1.p1
MKEDEDYLEFRAEVLTEETEPPKKKLNSTRFRRFWESCEDDYDFVKSESDKEVKVEAIAAWHGALSYDGDSETEGEIEEGQDKKIVNEGQDRKKKKKKKKKKYSALI